MNSFELYLTIKILKFVTMTILSIYKLLWVLSLLYSITLAFPVAESSDGSSLMERATPGSSKDNPINADFDIAKWPDLAEEDCYAMLCLGMGTVL